MKHVHPMSRRRVPAKAELSAFEEIIILVLGVYFRDWTNYSTVIEDLEKYYTKT